MLPVPLIFTAGVASGVDCYAVVLVLGLAGRSGHVAAIPPTLEKPSILLAAALLYIGQFIVGKVRVLDIGWDLAHTLPRPVAGGAVGVLLAQQVGAGTNATVAAATIGGLSALASHVVKTGVRIGVNASPGPFAVIAVSLLEDAGVVGLTWWALHHERDAALVAAPALAVGLIVVVLLGTRIRDARRRRNRARQWHREARDRRRVAAGSV
jgi:hypothetical protein